MGPYHYLRLWAACARYSLTRQMMFRVDFLVWFLCDFLWMAMNLVLVEVVFHHIDALAGWSKHEMLLLIGTSQLLMRAFTSLFLSNFYEFGRNVRTGGFDFALAQPGNPLFIISTRKLELDGASNTLVALGIVVYAARALGLTPDAATIAWYAAACLCGLAIHYAVMCLLASAVFWITNSQGMENGYFTLFEFSRLPRSAYRGAAQAVFVWALPVVVVSTVPASILRSGPSWPALAGLAALAAAWLSLAIWVFHRGLRRYASASS